MVAHPTLSGKYRQSLKTPMVVFAIIITYSSRFGCPGSRAVIAERGGVLSSQEPPPLRFLIKLKRPEGWTPIDRQNLGSVRVPDASEASAVEPGDPKRTYKPRNDSSRLHSKPLPLPQARVGEVSNGEISFLALVGRLKDRLRQQDDGTRWGTESGEFVSKGPALDLVSPGDLGHPFIVRPTSIIPGAYCSPTISVRTNARY